MRLANKIFGISTLKLPYNTYQIAINTKCLGPRLGHSPLIHFISNLDLSNSNG